MAQVKKYKCREKAIGCFETYTKRSSFQKHCDNLQCSIQKVNRDKAAKQEKEAKKKRETRKSKLDAIQPYSYWEKKAQTSCNRYIRELRKDDPCIMCGTFNHGQWHAGHFMSVGSRRSLRFHPYNIWRQGSNCNKYRGDLQWKYKKNLVEKIGADFVEYLETYHDNYIPSVEDLNEIEQHYKSLYKELILTGATDEKRIR